MGVGPCLLYLRISRIGRRFCRTQSQSQCFNDFKNNDAFRFSKSTGVSVTEDLSKRTREARQEMRKSVGIIMRMMIRMIKMLSQVYDGCKVKVKEVNMMLVINSNSSPTIIQCSGSI